MKTNLLFLYLVLALLACSRKADESDAYGNFEAIETIVSAEATGTLQAFSVEEGQTLQAGQLVGQIDTTQLQLRKAQLVASTQAVDSRTPDVEAQLSYYDQQIAVQQQQLKTM